MAGMSDRDRSNDHQYTPEENAEADVAFAALMAATTEEKE